MAVGEAFNVAGVVVAVCVAVGGAIAWLFGHDRRIAVLERDREFMEAWLGRVESKLDRVIERPL